MAKTYFDSVEVNKSISPAQIIYHTKQFGWFRDSMGRALTDDNGKNAIKLLSAIRFSLPYVPGREAQSYLFVVGDGCGVCLAYLAQVNTGQDIITGVIPRQPSKLYRLFSFSEQRNRNGYEKDVEKGMSGRLGQIFVTGVYPFLKGMEYPIEADRHYDLSINWANETMRVTAENREDREKQRLKLFYIPDSRDGLPKQIVELHKNREGWTSKSLEEIIPTELFTFSSTINE